MECLTECYRNLLLGGRKGHIASFDWKNKKLHSEFHVRETVRDVKWLHNETMYAVAQKKYTYIYDRTGMELHCLRNHIEANALEYLPYHWLIASVVRRADVFLRRIANYPEGESREAGLPGCIHRGGRLGDQG